MVHVKFYDKNNPMQKLNKLFLLKLLNILMFIATLYVNYLSVVYKIGGKSIRELSDKYDNLFTPSPGTFAIWSLIYILIMVFLVLQFFEKYANQLVVRNAYFAISCLLNCAWIICWQFEYLNLSLVVMLGLLTTLAIINNQIKEGRSAILKIVFGVYLGWICIATVANATALLVSMNLAIHIQTQEVITIVMMILSAIIVIGVMYKLANTYLSIAVSWAFYGIYLKRVTDFSVIAHTAMALSVLVLLSAVLIYRKVQLNVNTK